MRLILSFLLITLIFAACTNSPEVKEEKTTVENSDKKAIPTPLEVFCFHGTRQCTTCKNMKANTRETLETHFAEQLKNGTIVFAIVDVDDEKNYKLAEKFEATGTALMFNKVVAGKDNIIDKSDFAFEKANDKAAYISELKSIIEEIQK